MDSKSCNATTCEIAGYALALVERKKFWFGNLENENCSPKWYREDNNDLNQFSSLKSRKRTTSSHEKYNQSVGISNVVFVTCCYCCLFPSRVSQFLKCQLVTDPIRFPLYTTSTTPPLGEDRSRRCDSHSTDLVSRRGCAENRG